MTVGGVAQEVEGRVTDADELVTQQASVDLGTVSDGALLASFVMAEMRFASSPASTRTMGCIHLSVTVFGVADMVRVAVLERACSSVM